MKHQWTALLWELWAALCLCTAWMLPPGSTWSREPALLWPGLMLALVVPAGWAAWGLWADPPQPLPPEQRLEAARPFVPALCGLPAELAGCRIKQKPLYREPGTEALFVNQKAIKRSC